MTLLTVLLVGISILGAGPQSGLVKAKFEIDGKQSKDKFRIVLYADGVATEPSVSDDGYFSVPTLNIRKVDVRLISDKYNLLYENVYLAKLRGTLIFGVKENFSDDESPCKPGQKLVSFHSLEFHPRRYRGNCYDGGRL